MLLKDKVAIVTGSTRGIGKAIAMEFAKEGADVVVVGTKSRQAGEEVVHSINAMGRKAIFILTDVANAEQVRKLVDTATEHFGRIDILVNNAGVMGHTTGPRFWNTPEEHWHEIINSHLFGTVNCIRAVVGQMMERKKGKIINVTSAAGLVGGVGVSAYAAAKGGIIALTKVLAMELGPYKINVNAIAPQAQTDALTLMQQRPKFWAEIEKRYILGLPQPEDIAPAFTFLASEGAKYVTGQIWNVDSGFVI